MTYSCSDFADSILDALGIVVPEESMDSPSDQADLALAAIDALRNRSIKIWVLTTCIPGDEEPCHPHVFTDRDLAYATMENVLRDEWESNGSADDDGESAPFPDDLDEAMKMMASNSHGNFDNYGKWEITEHDCPLN